MNRVCNLDSMFYYSLDSISISCLLVEPVFFLFIMKQLNNLFGNTYLLFKN